MRRAWRHHTTNRFVVWVVEAMNTKACKFDALPIRACLRMNLTPPPLRRCERGQVQHTGWGKAANLRKTKVGAVDLEFGLKKGRERNDPASQGS